VKKGIVSLLLLGIVAVLLLLGLTVFGPWDLPGLGQLSQRQAGQESSAQIFTPPAPAPDQDRDGFSDSVEQYVGTDPADNCADNVKDAAWPPDINNDKLVNSSDVEMMKSRMFKKAVGEHRRYDLNRDQTINAGDVDVLSKFLNRLCPIQFLKATAASLSVTFSWQPEIRQDEFPPVKIFISDMTASGQTVCNKEGAVNAINSGDIPYGAAAWFWDQNHSSPPIAGHKYCSYMYTSDVVSNFVEFTTLASPKPTPYQL